MFRKLTPLALELATGGKTPLWDALGFARAAEVPAGNALGFVILVRDGVEVMYQTFDSVRGDEPKVLEGADRVGTATLFIEVDDLDAVTKLVPDDADIIVRRRTTSYGATEMFLRDLAGNVIAFAQMH